MATALQTLPTESLRVTYENGKFVLDDEPWIAEWSKLRACTSALEWFEQIIEAERAAYRLKKIVKHEPLFDPEDAAFPDNEIQSRGLTAEEKQRIIHLRLSEQFSVAALATRFNCGRTTIRRVFAEYEQRSHNPSAVQHGPNREHGDQVFSEKGVTQFGRS